MIAAVVSWAEFWLECWFMPVSVMRLCIPLGVLMICCGHYCRISAMFHAGESFHHVVQTKKADAHVLITDGIYGVFRHPSYFGWSLWAIGTQVLLGNPICCFLYRKAAELFFVERIPHEEEYLCKFFGQAYLDYCERVPIRMSFLNIKT